MSTYPPQSVQNAAAVARAPAPFAGNTYNPQARMAGSKFVLALMTCRKDFILSLDQLDWFRELDGHPLEAECVLTTAWDLRGSLEDLLLKRASECIRGPVHHNPAPFALWSELWPLGPNWLFALTAKFCFDHQFDYLLLEPDAVAVQPGWFDAIRREYAGCGRAFMGHLEPQTAAHPAHIAGCCCYAFDVWTAGTARALHSPFDLQLALDGVVRQGLAHATPSILQVWSTIPGGNIAPEFPSISSLDIIHPKTMVFHRCKSNSLISRLREQRALRR
jgi:hypothetical protein